ncbi:hypothetical protein HQ447_12235 [bacterium]|nr:hypothetical protein [bacterium]
MPASLNVSAANPVSHASDACHEPAISMAAVLGFAFSGKATTAKPSTVAQNSRCSSGQKIPVVKPDATSARTAGTAKHTSSQRKGAATSISPAIVVTR